MSEHAIDFEVLLWIRMVMIPMRPDDMARDQGLYVSLNRTLGILWEGI